ncbi:MAG TPA: DUF2190 family protein [Gemmatimonadaceae bacterium]|nr:DUF2190 family protein [Gemmatimonadaceae bacterium]
MPTDWTSRDSSFPLHIDVSSGPLTQRRLYRVTGVDGAGVPTLTLCGNGQDADGVAHANVQDGAGGFVGPGSIYLACPGFPVRVEAGAAFASGATLQSDANGRAITKTTGTGILRALEAAGAAGDYVWAVWLSGR